MLLIIVFNPAVEAEQNIAVVRIVDKAVKLKKVKEKALTARIHIENDRGCGGGKW
jgi:hypothetical protein